MTEQKLSQTEQIDLANFEMHIREYYANNHKYKEQHLIELIIRTGALKKPFREIWTKVLSEHEL